MSETPDSQIMSVAPEMPTPTVYDNTINIGEDAGYFRQGVLTVIGTVGTLPSAPISDESLMILQGGVLQKNPTNYTRDGATINFVLAPGAAEVIYYYPSIEAAQGPSEFPVGAMIPFAGPASEIPANCLRCDGTDVSRTTYAVLFAVIGTNFGVGDGSTTFGLPDLDAVFFDGANNVYDMAIIRFR